MTNQQVELPFSPKGKPSIER